jgi:hypothetical protein
MSGTVRMPSSVARARSTNVSASCSTSTRCAGVTGRFNTANAPAGQTLSLVNANRSGSSSSEPDLRISLMRSPGTRITSAIGASIKRQRAPSAESSSTSMERSAAAVWVGRPRRVSVSWDICE